MPDLTSPRSIEDQLRAATRTPAPRPEFLAGLRARLVEQPPTPVSRLGQVGMAFRRPAIATALAAIVILIAGLAIVGPQKALAAVGHLFGYIPGVGIVDRSAPLRVLAEPVSQTRAGVTLSVTSATLTGDRTHLNFRFFGVLGSAYPDREDTPGCHQPEYLRLPDGIQLERTNDFPPVPGGVDQAVLVIPCIFDTLPGKAPENWELALRFVPAPPELTVMPVTEVSASREAAAVASATPHPLPTGQATAATAAAQDQSITIDQVIETVDGYILTAKFEPQIPAGKSIQVAGPAQIHDARGKQVSFSIPVDVPPPDVNNPGQGGFGLAFQFKAAGLAYPLTISLSGVEVQPADPQATASFSFDAGSNPQPGQQWTPDREIQLGGHTFKLLQITADSRGGFSFKFAGDPQVVGASLDIAGYTPNGGGGGGPTNGVFFVSLSYAQTPIGPLEVTVSNLMVTGSAHTWQGRWSPAVLRSDLPANPTAQAGVCLAAEPLDGLESAPANLSGSALVYQALEGSDQWGLVSYALDGSQKKLLAANSSWGALSPDGSQMAYPAVDGIHVVDLASGAEKVLAGSAGFNLRWSPDGTQIAYIGGSRDQAFVVTVASLQAQQVSDQSYETVIGWSPDGARLYIAIPFTGGGAWQVRAVDPATGTFQDLFTIENGSAKALEAALSPDGGWIVYRGRDNSSIYLVHPDGSQMRLLVDNPSSATTGLVWSRSGWLGMSLLDANTQQDTSVILKPDGCQAYRLPGVAGVLQGLFVR
jgi:Tol biopolymer transport system component